MKFISKTTVQQVSINENSDSQRVDNFLIKILGSVPKAFIYKIIRKGEIRVNSRRVKPKLKLKIGDVVRIPPVNLEKLQFRRKKKKLSLKFDTIFEDEDILVINKPPKVAVHGGTGISVGLISLLRENRENSFLELAHRIDKDTSGALLLAKNRKSLLYFHTAFREGNIRKEYYAVISGEWNLGNKHRVEIPLLKNIGSDGGHGMTVNEAGDISITDFEMIARGKDYSMVRAFPITGRTHQIRAHLAYLGFPICGDTRYGSKKSNKIAIEAGVKRMLLHSRSLAFNHPTTKKRVKIECIEPNEFQLLL